MGRTVVGDETQLEGQVDNIFRLGASVQVGLLVGKLGLGSTRDLVFALVPTPPKDGEEAASVGSSEPKGQKEGSSSKKGNKGKPFAEGVPVQIAVDWVAEHARQVSRMLLGGVHIVGIYLFSSEGSFKSSLSTLWKAVTAVAAAAPSAADGGGAPEYLLLHISSSPRRLSCRSCPGNAPFSATALRPCEWKVGKLLNNLQEFTCRYSVDIRFPVVVDQPSKKLDSLRKYLHSAITAEAHSLHSAQAIVDGSLVQAENILGSGSTVHEVELIQPLDGGVLANSIRNGVKTKGRVFFKGEMFARAYAVVREPLSRAVDDLKGDIIASLRSRLALLIDEAEEAEEDARMQTDTDDSLITPSSETLLSTHLSFDVSEHSFAMPRRVLVPWLEGAMICDYMLPDETLEDVQERCMDLFGFEQTLDTSSVFEPETLGSVPEITLTPPKVAHTPKAINANVDAKGHEFVALERSSSFFLYPLIYAGAALTLLLAFLLSRFWMQKSEIAL